jgi:hydrogenase maturation factor
MRVVEATEFQATVEGCDEVRIVSLLWTGPLTVGTPVLVHQDRAIRVLDEAEVESLEKAIRSLKSGERLEDVPPELPLHLRPANV